MAQLVTDGKIVWPSLTTTKVDQRNNAVFTETGSGAVVVKVGEQVALISREELAAASALFPYRPKQ